MQKRNFLAGLLTLPFFAVAAKAGTVNQRNTATWRVPPGVSKIRVRSWNSDGTPDMDRVLSVEPNQTFRIDAIEG